MKLLKIFVLELPRCPIVRQGNPIDTMSEHQERFREYGSKSADF